MKARHFKIAWQLAVLLAVVLVAGGARAADQPQSQPGRFLIIFETSPVMKKNLPGIQQGLAALFASNLSNELQTDDDVAVWTVDQDMHAGGFPLASWEPEEAAMYTDRLNDFLGRQKFSRRAGLAALQPALNRVVKGSDKLTVLIFCDSQSRLLGTPYDSGVNEIITNAAARLKGGQIPLVLVLRAHHGEYLGCSVNRSGPLNFPKFPAPPVVKPAPAPAPPPAPMPVISTVPPLIIVGTNASTNISALTKPAATAAPTPTPPPPVVHPTNIVVVSAPVPATPAPKVVTVPPAAPTVVSNTPLPAKPLTPPVAVTPAPKIVPPEPVTAPPPDLASSNPSVASESNTITYTTEDPPRDAAYLLPLYIGGGALVLAAGLVLWLVMRARQPRGSLITSSMQDDPRLPPRK